MYIWIMRQIKLNRAVPPRVGLSETKVKLIVRQMAEAIMFVHSRSIVHRDLKLENFLVFQVTFFISLCNFLSI